MRPALPSSFFTMSNSPLRRRVRRSTSHSRGALCPRVLAFPFASIPLEGWAERRQAHYFVCRVSETRRVRTQRGAARPMTRDARLSALHRGDFGPGTALPSPALPPDPCSDAPRSQVVMPGGRCPGPPEPAVTSRGRRTPLPAPPFRTVSGRRPSMSEDGKACTPYSLRSQSINAYRSRQATVLACSQRLC
jgi:hypothetical protein